MLKGIVAILYEKYKSMLQYFKLLFYMLYMLYVNCYVNCYNS